MQETVEALNYILWLLNVNIYLIKNKYIYILLVYILLVYNAHTML